MKIIVYSCNFGNYDRIKLPNYLDKNVKYILFTDNKNLKTSIWSSVYVDTDAIHKDKQRVARYYKANPHIVLPEHDISVWIDSSFIINIQNFERLVKELLGKLVIACYPHPNRICTYQEANICLNMKLDDEKIIQRQIGKYRKERLPNNYGLFATGFLIRGKGMSVKGFNEKWWREIEEGSKRDQLSFAYVAWKLGMFVRPILDGTIYKNPYLSKEKHLIPRGINK